MIEAIVRASLQQRLVLLVIFVVLGVFGARSVQKLSLDAFPDVTTIQVQVATEAPGRSPEEVERFVTVPIEIYTDGRVREFDAAEDELARAMGRQPPRPTRRKRRA
jgi:cobalt-zinc-cadmium resistance protein CzcA